MFYREGVPLRDEALTEEHDCIQIRATGRDVAGQQWGCDQFVAQSAIRHAGVPIIGLATDDMRRKLAEKGVTDSVSFDWRWFDFPVTGEDES